MSAFDPDVLLEMERSFSKRMAAQMEAALGRGKLDTEAEIAARRDYLQQLVEALKDTEAARQEALARFDADIDRRKRQIGQVEAELKGADAARGPARPATRKARKAGDSPGDGGS